MNIHAIEEINDASAQRPPVLAIRFGRGRTGGTTFLDFVIQRARRADCRRLAVEIGQSVVTKGCTQLRPIQPASYRALRDRHVIVEEPPEKRRAGLRARDAVQDDVRVCCLVSHPPLHTRRRREQRLLIARPRARGDED